MKTVKIEAFEFYELSKPVREAVLERHMLGLSIEKVEETRAAIADRLHTEKVLFFDDGTLVPTRFLTPEGDGTTATFETSTPEEMEVLIEYLRMAEEEGDLGFVFSVEVHND